MELKIGEWIWIFIPVTLIWLAILGRQTYETSYHPFTPKPPHALLTGTYQGNTLIAIFFFGGAFVLMVTLAAGLANLLNIPLNLQQLVLVGFVVVLTIVLWLALSMGASAGFDALFKQQRRNDQGG